jgi:hypothetical protein
MQQDTLKTLLQCGCNVLLVRSKFRARVPSCNQVPVKIFSRVIVKLSTFLSGIEMQDRYSKCAVGAQLNYVFKE